MRALFLLILLANLALFVLGQGLFGPVPSEAGREPRALNERNQQAVTLGAPQSDVVRR